MVQCFYIDDTEYKLCNDDKDAAFVMFKTGSHVIFRKTQVHFVVVFMTCSECSFIKHIFEWHCNEVLPKHLLV